MFMTPPDVEEGMCQRALKAVKLLSFSPYRSDWMRH